MVSTIFPNEFQLSLPKFNETLTCCSNLLCFSSLSLLSLSSLSLLALSLSLSSLSLASLSRCSRIGSGLMVQGAGGGNPGKVGGRGFTAGGKLPTDRCRLRQGSCRPPRPMSLELANGDRPNGDGAAPGNPDGPYLLNGDKVLPVKGDLATSIYG